MDNIFGKRFKQLRQERCLNQQEFIDIFNDKYNYNFTRQAVSLYENGKRMPEIDALTDFARYFDVSIDYLLGRSNFKNIDTDKKTDETDLSKITNIKPINQNDMVKIPVLGVIKAGIPMFAEENIIDYEYVHQEELVMGEEYFYLEVKGDSMINASIKDGSRVLIKRQTFIETDGSIYAVRVNGDEATLKRVYMQQNGLVLQSENAAYAPMFFPASDVETGYVGIIGKAIKVEIKL